MALWHTLLGGVLAISGALLARLVDLRHSRGERERQRRHQVAQDITPLLVAGTKVGYMARVRLFGDYADQERRVLDAAAVAREELAPAVFVAQTHAVSHELATQIEETVGQIVGSALDVLRSKPPEKEVRQVHEQAAEKLRAQLTDLAAVLRDLNE